MFPFPPYAPRILHWIIQRSLLNININFHVVFDGVHDYNEVDRELTMPYKYSSITSPNVEHPQPQQFAAEMIVYRTAIHDGVDLPAYFWRKNSGQDKYRELYLEYCKMMGKAMKVAPDHFVVQVATYSNLTDLTYGKLMGTIKYRWESWNERISTRFKNIVKQQHTARDFMEALELNGDSTNEAKPIKSLGAERKVRW